MKKKAIIIVLVSSISLWACGAANCPKGDNATRLESHSVKNAGIYTPQGLTTLVNIGTGFLGVGSVDPIDKIKTSWHYTKCCATTNQRTDWRLELTSVIGGFDLNVSVGASLTAPIDPILGGLEGSGLASNVVSSIQNFLSGLNVTGAGISGKYSANFYDPVMQEDSCKCDESSEMFSGTESYTVSGCLGKYDSSAVPGGADIIITLGEVNIQYKKIGYLINDNTAYIKKEWSAIIRSEWKVGSDADYEVKEERDFGLVIDSHDYCVPNPITKLDLSGEKIHEN